MATVTVRPTTYKNPSKDGYLNGLGNIGNVLNSSDTSYGSTSYTTTFGYTVFRMIWSASAFNSIPTGSVINSVTCYIRAGAQKSKMTLANAGYSYKDCSSESAWGDGSDTGTRMTEISVSKTWSSTSISAYSFAVPKGNVKNGLTMYFRFNNDAIASNELRVAQIYVVVDYTVPKFTITAVASPTNGGTVSGGGSYNSGTSVTLTATAASGYKFTKWSTGSTNASITVTATANATYTAYFEADLISKIYVANTAAKSIYVGNTKAKAVYIGNTKIYG